MYTKTNWTETTPRSLANLNKMETQYDEAIADGVTLRADNTEELRLEVRSDYPVSPQTGRVFFHSTDKIIYFYNGAGWVGLPGTMGKTIYNRGYGEADWEVGIISSGASGYTTMTKKTDHLHILFDGFTGTFTMYASWVTSLPVDMADYDFCLVEWATPSVRSEYNFYLQTGTKNDAFSVNYVGSLYMPRGVYAGSTYQKYNSRIMSLDDGITGTTHHIRLFASVGSGPAGCELEIYAVTLFKNIGFNTIWGPV